MRFVRNYFVVWLVFDLATLCLSGEPCHPDANASPSQTVLNGFERLASSTLYMQNVKQKPSAKRPSSALRQVANWVLRKEETELSVPLMKKWPSHSPPCYWKFDSFFAKALAIPDTPPKDEFFQKGVSVKKVEVLAEGREYKFILTGSPVFSNVSPQNDVSAVSISLVCPDNELLKEKDEFLFEFIKAIKKLNDETCVSWRLWSFNLWRGPESKGLIDQSIQLEMPASPSSFSAVVHPPSNRVVDEFGKFLWVTAPQWILGSLLAIEHGNRFKPGVWKVVVELAVPLSDFEKPQPLLLEFKRDMRSRGLKVCCRECGESPAVFREVLQAVYLSNKHVLSLPYRPRRGFSGFARRLFSASGCPSVPDLQRSLTKGLINLMTATSPWTVRNMTDMVDGHKEAMNPASFPPKEKLVLTSVVLYNTQYFEKARLVLYSPTLKRSFYAYAEPMHTVRVSSLLRKNPAFDVNLHFNLRSSYDEWGPMLVGRSNDKNFILRSGQLVPELQ